MASTPLPWLAAGLFLMAVLSTAVGEPSEGGDRLSSGGEPSPDTLVARIHYPAEAEEWRAEWVATGGLVIQVPEHPDLAPSGEIRLTGTRLDLFEDHWDYTHEDGSTTYGGPLTSIAVRGPVEGLPGSQGLLLIGEYGLYGTIDVPVDAETSYSLSFDVGDPDASEGVPAIDEDDQFVTMLKESGPNPSISVEPVMRPVHGLLAAVGPVLDLPGTEVGLPGDPLQVAAAMPGGFGSGCQWTVWSMTRHYSEYNLWTTQSNWRDRMQSAFTQYYDMWHELCINPFQQSISALSWNLLTTNTCDGSSSVRNQFSNWLWNSNTARNNLHWRSYQLWTKRDLEAYDFWLPDDYMCFGEGKSDSTVYHMPSTTDQQNNAHRAASVIEGWDNNDGDVYDPDEVHERAIVSGHELGHVHGEENHPDGTDSFCEGKHNIMKNGIDKDDARTCFIYSSKVEVKNWYFNGWS